MRGNRLFPCRIGKLKNSCVEPPNTAAAQFDFGADNARPDLLEKHCGGGFGGIDCGRLVFTHGLRVLDFRDSCVHFDFGLVVSDDGEYTTPAHAQVFFIIPLFFWGWEQNAPQQ